ncbi:MAG TPA: twin transmembrane helix small protein [Rhodoferax sp.]
MKYFVILSFFAIVVSLGAALFFMMKSDSSGKCRSQKMALALALRVGLSIALFITILLAWKFGLIHPSGISVRQ